MYQMLSESTGFCRRYDKKHFGAFYRFTVYTISQLHYDNIAYCSQFVLLPCLLMFSHCEHLHFSKRVQVFLKMNPRFYSSGLQATVAWTGSHGE